MFNRYWRTYPWGLQLALFILMVFTLSSFGAYLALALLPRISGVSFNDLARLTPSSSPQAVRAGLAFQAITTAIGTFAAPALLFASFTHPRVREYLGLRAPGRPVHWLIVTGIMAGLLPVVIWGENFSREHLHFGKWADNLQKMNDDIFKAYLSLETGPDLALMLLVMALLPALGEELVFRGVLMRLFHRRIYRYVPTATGHELTAPQDAQRSMLFPVIFTALLFAAIHFNPYGFAFIFIAGCMLSLIYYLTGSLLCSIWAHFLFNGVQVAAIFLSRHDDATRKIIEGENLPALVPVAGLLLFGACFYTLVRTQTPLPPGWSLDFRPGEEEERWRGE